MKKVLCGSAYVLPALIAFGLFYRATFGADHRNFENSFGFTMPTTSAAQFAVQPLIEQRLREIRHEVTDYAQRMNNAYTRVTQLPSNTRQEIEYRVEMFRQYQEMQKQYAKLERRLRCAQSAAIHAGMSRST